MYQRSYQIDYFFGWRYLLSAKFRREAREKWSGGLYLRCLLLTGITVSIIITSIAYVLLIMSIWQLLA